MALVGPEGQALTFMSDLGGGVGVNGATITFSDSAVTGPPNALVSGTFKPSNVGVGDTFAVPGPVSYQSASPAGVATFASAFGGINPNGTWSLYVVDDTGFYSGSISGGWSLSVELNASSALPVTPTGPSPADDAGLASSPAVLDWADATGATSYDVYFDGRLHASVTTSQWTVNQSLAAGRHEWWVIARNAIGSTQGPAWSFVVLATRINGLACRVPTCTGTVTQIFIERVDQPDRSIARNEKTWIVVHGRGNSADTQEISDLAQAIATVRSGEQVLVLDWKNGAKYSGPLGELTDFTGEDWIKPVGTAAARMLEDYGFEGQHLFLIGHSWGSYVSDELAERMPFVRGANAPSRVGGLVALDPAKDVPNASSGGVYDPDQGSEIDFGAHSVCSWAFRSSSAGSVVTPSTAEESFKIDTQIGYAPASHGIVRTLFKTIIEDRLGSVSDASKYFQLDRLSPCQSGPWILNRFNEHGDRAEGGPYEGVIYAVGGVLSRVDFDGAMPTNFRVLSMTGNLVRLGWTLPASTAATTNIRLEGGLTRGQVLGTLTLPAAQESTVTLPSGSFFLRIRAVAGGVLSEPSDELVAQVNVPAAPSAPLSLLGLASGSTLALAWTNNYLGGAPSSLVLDVTGSIATSVPISLSESFSFTGVPGGTYTLALRAQNATGLSAPSNSVTLTFPSACSGPPDVPSYVSAYQVGGTVYVGWAPGLGPAPTGYVLHVSGAAVGAFATSTRSISGVVGSGSYSFSVVAVNPCGASHGSTPRTVIVP